MKKWWDEQWRQTKEAAAHSWKYETGSRLVFILLMVALIMLLGECFKR